MKAAYRNLFSRLLDEYGPQNWWPADDAFEMMVGAILIQHTAWANASRAIENLKDADLLAAARLDGAKSELLSELIRPAGTHRVKTRRIQAFVRWYRSNGELARLRELSTLELRAALLSVHGIGPETADDILVYAFGRPVFVVDAYARRFLTRYGLIQGDESYRALQAMIEDAFADDAAVLGELHALVVEHAKRSCRPKPLCQSCCFREDCARIFVETVTRDG